MRPPLVFLENDPGVPEGMLDDPYAGLDAEAALALREEVEGVLEGKAIGTGNLGGDVAGRDAALRQVPSTQIRTSVRLGGINVTRDLAPVEEEARKSIGMLLRMWLRGGMTEQRAMLEMSRRWREAYERVREIGRRAAGIDKLPVSSDVLREEEEWFRSFVREELRHWHVFMEEIREGRVGGIDEFVQGKPAGRLYQRFESYLSALRAMYEASRVYALPRDVLVYWMGPKRGDPEICEGCVYLMERSPFPKDRLPAVPRDGTTECLTNCRHRVVLRVARALADVQRRRAALPPRESMVRDLERIRIAKHGTHRHERGREIARELPRPQSVNPFIGQTLPPRRG